MFDCVITVKGNGKGENGWFKHDKTGPVSQFMVDNTYLYPIVRRHVAAPRARRVLDRGGEVTK